MASLCLFLVPTAAAQGATDADVRAGILATPGSDITFYGHIFGINRGLPMPMNTQFPANEDDFSRGYGGNCGTLNGVPLEADTDGEYTCGADLDLNENYWYTTAGFVQVKNSDEWGEDYGKFHNERGQTKDIYFDTSKPIQSTYWMSADAHGWSTLFCDVVVASVCWNWDPGYFQDWVVEVTVYHANLGEWSTDPSAKPDMALVSAEGEGVTKVAQGASVPQDIISMDGTVPVVGGQTVWPFDVELTWDAAFDGRIPYDENLIVKFEWFQQSDSGERYILAPNALLGGVSYNVNAGEDYPPKIVFPVRNPMDVELVYPRFVHDKLVVLGIINTPWGSYDIDVSRTGLTVKDPSGTVIPVDPKDLSFSIDSSVAHGGHYKPINATWVWDYQEAGLKAGTYSLEVHTENFQHSYQTSTIATFTIADDGTGSSTGAGRGGLASFSQDQFETFEGASGADVATEAAPTATSGKGSPGLGMVVALAALAAVALIRRRTP